MRGTSLTERGWTAQAPSRGIPEWVSAPSRAGLEAWTPEGWQPARPAAHPNEYALLLSHFLSRVQNPFRLDRGVTLFFGRDDLALSQFRPRHEGLDIGSRIRVATENRITTLPPETRVHTLVPGGFLVGVKNLQKVLYLLRDGPRRFRLIVELRYDHIRFQGKARGSIRVFPAADHSAFLKWPSAASQAIHRDGQIVGYEALGWIRHPGTAVGTLEAGRYESMDPLLIVRHIPKGNHLHLSIAGIHDDDPPRKARFLNEELRRRLETV